MKNHAVVIGFICLLIALDQGVKSFSTSHFLFTSSPDDTTIYQGRRSDAFSLPSETAEPFRVEFFFSYVRNHGSAFGTFREIDPSSRVLLFNLVTIASILLGIWLLPKYLAQRPTQRRAALAFMMSGAVSNALDRSIRGFVVGSLGVKWTIQGQETIPPVFNLADVFVVIGLFLLFDLLLRVEKDSSNT